MIVIFLYVGKYGNIFMNFPIILFKLHNDIENISAGCVRVSSSPSWVAPSRLPSRQIRKEDQTESLWSMMPSLLKSNSRSASKPFAASVPLASCVKLLKSSAPVSIRPLWLRSRTSRPSPVLIQPVWVRLPSPAK